jgi:hypothetical protein
MRSETKPKIEPCGGVISHRTCGLRNLNAAEISAALGFPPNVADDPDKVVDSWSFVADGEPCAVWDYRGSERFDRYSAFGPRKLLESVFGAESVTD